MFQKELDVDETLAQLLVAEGFGALEEVAYVEADEIAGIEGFDEELASERSEEHTSELQSLMRISYAVFCLKKKKLVIKANTNKRNHIDQTTKVNSTEYL